MRSGGSSGRSASAGATMTTTTAGGTTAGMTLCVALRVRHDPALAERVAAYSRRTGRKVAQPAPVAASGSPQAPEKASPQPGAATPGSRPPRLLSAVSPETAEPEAQEGSAAARVEPAAAAVAAAAQAQTAGLPPGWHQHQDPRSARPYYVDPQGQSHWQLPTTAQQPTAAQPTAQQREQVESRLGELFGAQAQNAGAAWHALGHAR